jgi:hypothetical protein
MNQPIYPFINHLGPERDKKNSGTMIEYSLDWAKKSKISW